MPVRAFVDDSGSGGDSRYYVLGGFMADFETWEAFSDAWVAILAAEPSIEYFKMQEANSLKYEFQNFTERERDDKVKALIDVINAHEMFQGSCAVEASDYADVVTPILGTRWKGQYDDPYLYLFTGIITHFSAMEHRWEYAQRGVSPDQIVLFDATEHSGKAPQKVDFVFDEGAKLKDRQARTLYEKSLKDLGLFQDRVGSVDFRDDKLFMPLQAADLAAWQRRRRLCARGEGTRWDYERLHRNLGRFKHTMLHRDHLIDIINHILERLKDIQP